MRHANHNLAILLLPEKVCHFLGHLYRVVVDNAYAFIRLHQPFHLRGQAEDSDFHPFAHQGDIRLHQPFEYRTRHVIIGTDHGKIRHTEQFRHILKSEIKFMITYRHGIIAHEVHHLDLQLAFEKVIIRGALRDVSAIQQQHIRMLAAKLLYKTGTAHHTAHPGILVGSLGADGFYTAVRIAGVQDKQLFSGLAGRYRIGGHQAKGSMKSSRAAKEYICFIELLFF